MLKKMLEMIKGHVNRRRMAEAMALQSSAVRRLACYGKNKWIRGQQVMEYSLFIAAIAAAFTTMYLYAQRGLQGVIKASADQMASQADSEQTIGADNTITVSDTITETSGSVSIDQSPAGSSIVTSTVSSTTGLTTTTSESF